VRITLYWKTERQDKWPPGTEPPAHPGPPT
jgi:hypothetical protein